MPESLNGCYNVSVWKRVKSQEWTKDILVSSMDINNVLTGPPPTCSTKLQQQQKALDTCHVKRDT